MLLAFQNQLLWLWIRFSVKTDLKNSVWSHTSSGIQFISQRSFVQSYCSCSALRLLTTLSSSGVRISEFMKAIDWGVREMYLKGGTVVFGIPLWGVVRKDLSTCQEIWGFQEVVKGETRVSKTWFRGTSGWFSVCGGEVCEKWSGEWSGDMCVCRSCELLSGVSLRLKFLKDYERRFLVMEIWLKRGELW